MNTEPINEKLNAKDTETLALDKTTRISLEEILSVKPAGQPAGPAPPPVPTAAEKKATGPISGVPLHTAPIPQTIKLKRPATAPITIGRPAEIAAAPTVVKAVPAKLAGAPVSETPTVIKKAVSAGALRETSRIIIDAPAADLRKKTAPLPIVSPFAPTPPPKTIRLKRPSGIVPISTPEEKLPAPALAETPVVTVETPPAKKLETAKIELPAAEAAEYQVPSTQRKTIKIKRSDRNIIPRTVVLSRKPELIPAEAKPRAAPVPQKAEPAAKPPLVPEEPLPAFALLTGLAVVCLLLLVYLLAAQAFGPKLILPVPAGLF